MPARPDNKRDVKHRLSERAGINFGLQLICQLDFDWDPFRCNLLGGGAHSLSAALPPLWFLRARARARAASDASAHKGRGVRSEAVDKLAVLTGTSRANADFVHLACGSALDIRAKDYSS